MPATCHKDHSEPVALLFRLMTQILQDSYSEAGRRDPVEIYENEKESKISGLDCVTDGSVERNLLFVQSLDTV